MSGAIDDLRSEHKTPKPVSLDEWLPYLDRFLHRLEQRHFHGQVTFSFYDGKINRLKVESSVVHPSELASDKIPSL